MSNNKYMLQTKQLDQKKINTAKIFSQVAKTSIGEVFGTFMLTFFACGVAVFSSQIGGAFYILTPLAFGAALIVSAYTFSNASGCHINPCVTLALWINKRITTKDSLRYYLCQFIGGILGSLFLYLILFLVSKESLGVAANQFTTEHLWSLDGNGIKNLFASLVLEVVLTFLFVTVVLFAVGKIDFGNATALIIGLGLTVVHLLGLYVDGTSVNPARSFGPAIVSLFNNKTQPLEQYFLFLIAPLIGTILAAYAFKAYNKNK